ncbi:tetratricopeptide repeat protein [Psychrobacter sp. SZ93C1]|uniref:tetratricopeptide repeat protein n=1 Tax=Psychrobacter sp. SZ93C1 TaxID=2792058 RepID=UPI0018CDD0BC|nr:tetratricopeptide repeat protein [Psychrobacter sp. SZ93C1]MBH0064998.1 tetratricopeptide repeat protein [Psychrobacter sp. SZ93C1]
MLLFLKHATSVKPAVIGSPKRPTSANAILVTSALISMLGLSACQTAPTTMTTAPSQTVPSSQMPDTSAPTETQAPTYEEDADSDYPIEPDSSSVESTNPLTQESPVFVPSNPIPTQPDTVFVIPSREEYVVPEPSIPSHSELLERARSNSQQRTQQATSNNSNLPAFRSLMQTGVNQLKTGQLTNAESSFTRAQRLAPKSSAVYFYLAQVALKKNQPRKAEAMARRGLSVSQDANRRRALWQIILQSGQAQGNSRVVSEAKQALR